jgi:hypothetical protein
MPPPQASRNTSSIDASEALVLEVTESHPEWQSQSTILLDRLLSIISSPTENPTTDLQRLTHLDAEIHAHLALVDNAAESDPNGTCVHVAMCIRILFPLHEHILEVLLDESCVQDNSGSNVTRRQQEKISHASLDMASRMILDVVDIHGTYNRQILPVTGYYTMIAAKEYLAVGEIGRQTGDRHGRGEILNASPEARREAVRRLGKAEDEYRRIWVL